MGAAPQEEARIQPGQTVSYTVAIPALEELAVVGLLDVFVFESFRSFLNCLVSLFTWTEERLLCLPVISSQRNQHIWGNGIF